MIIRSTTRSSFAFLGTLLGAVLICAVLFSASSAQAQSNISVTVPEVDGNQGETITLSVTADLDGNSVDGYTNMEFVYDADIAAIQDVRDGSELSFGSNQLTSNIENSNPSDPDTLSISNGSNSPVSGSGEFLQIDIQLQVDGGTPFELTPSRTPTGRPTSVFSDANDGSALEISTITQGYAGDAAQAQLIHNAADPNVQTVDLYIDGARWANDVSFRSATPLTNVKSGVEVKVGVAPANSSGPADTLYAQRETFSPNSAYTVVANGVLNPSNFSPNPDGEDTAFRFFVADGAQSSGPSGEVALRPIHGATDAPTVDIGEVGTTVFEDLTYSDVAATYTPIAAEQKRLVVRPADSKDIVNTFDSDLSGLGGSAATVLASGFLDPSANQGGPAFRLIAALPDGSVVTFDPAGVVPVKQARQNGAGATVTVRGTVTRAFGAYVRLQDVSGPTGASGLLIRQTSGSLSSDFQQDIDDGTIEQGTTLEATGTLSESNGLLRINNDDLSNYTVQGQGSLPSPQMVSFADLQSPDGEDYESELIRIEGVSFQDPSATGGTLASETDYTVEDGSGTPFTYRVQSSEETEVIGATIPNGTFNYEGVLGQSTTSGGDEGYQLVPVRASTGLPVEMARFKAVSSGPTVELTWQTASETNNAGFHVQRKTGEETWTDLGFVESKASGGTASTAHSYRYAVEDELAPGTHRFRLEQVDLDGTPHLSRVETVQVRMEEALRLSSPAPNPATGRATVSFAVRESAETTIAVYNVLGQRVQTLYEGTPQNGETTDLTFDAGGLSSGTYFLRMQVEGQVVSRRLTVVK